MKLPWILSSLQTQTGPWSHTFSCWTEIRWWSHRIRSSCEGIIIRRLYSCLILTSKIALWGQKEGVQHDSHFFCSRSNERGFTVYIIQISKINSKIKFNLLCLVTWKLCLKTKSVTKQPFFPALQKLTHMWFPQRWYTSSSPDVLGCTGRGGTDWVRQE